MKTSARPGKERKSNRPLKVQEFLDSPKPLLELLAEVVKRHAGTCRTGWNAEVIAQYSEVSRTVDRMRENRIPIPREILTLHESLSAQVEKKKHAFECLRAIEECLGRMHPEVATLVARLTTARKKTGIHSPPPVHVS